MKLLKQIRKRLLPPLIAYLGQGLLRLILLTCRVRLHGLEHFLRTAQRDRCLLVLWHNRIALVPYILSKYTTTLRFTAFVSKSRDGELLAAIAHTYSRGGTIRVPHQSRHQALKEMIRCVERQEEIVIVTPDGPRGPCYQVKQGVVLAAREAKACLIPFTWTASHFWQLNTWDQLRLPKPFSTLEVTFGNPFWTQSERPLEEEALRLQGSISQCENDPSIIAF